MDQTDAAHRRIVGYTLIGLACLLILAGIGLAIWQLELIPNPASPEFARRGLTANPSGRSIQTTYIGAVLIGIAALLAMIGASLFRAPRRVDPKGDQPG